MKTSMLLYILLNKLTSSSTCRHGRGSYKPQRKDKYRSLKARNKRVPPKKSKATNDDVRIIKKVDCSRNGKIQLIPLASRHCLGIRGSPNPDLEEVESEYSIAEESHNAEEKSGSDDNSSSIIYEFGTECDD
jgi:hypothetical protein